MPHPHGTSPASIDRLSLDGLKVAVLKVAALTTALAMERAWFARKTS